MRCEWCVEFEVEPGVHMLGVGLGDQGLVGGILNHRGHEAVGGLGGTHIDWHVCRFNGIFSVRKTKKQQQEGQDGATKFERLQAKRLRLTYTLSNWVKVAGRSHSERVNRKRARRPIGVVDGFPGGVR